MDVLAEVQNVTDRYAGSQLDGAVSAGATTIKVLNPWEFNTDADSNQLSIGGTVYTFTVPEILARVAPQNDSSVPTPSAGEMEPVDDEWDYAGTLNISPPAVTSYATETPVYQYPLITERWATLREPGGGEDLVVRVSNPMVPYMPKGARQPGTGEAVIASHRLGALHLTDQLGTLPAFNGTFIVNGTIKAQHIAVGALDGFTITAAHIRSANSDPRVIMDATGFYSNNASGTAVIKMLAGGGMTMLADTALGVQPMRGIHWTQGGSDIGLITAFEQLGTDIVGVVASPVGANATQVVLATEDASLQVASGGSGSWDVTVPNSSGTFKIIDSTGVSAFPKLTLPSDHYIHRGSGSTAFSAQSSKTVTVTHGMSSAPSAVVANADNALLYASVHNIGATTFQIDLTTSTGGNTSATIGYTWIAFT